MFLPQLRDKRAFISAIKERVLTLLNLKYHHDDELVGLDIGRDFIKLLKINRTKTPYVIENFSLIPTPAPIGSASKDPTKDNIAIATAVKSMFSQSGITTKLVALAIPRSIAILKTVTINSHLTPDEIEARAWIEANRHFPDLVGEIYLDFFMSGPVVGDDSRLEMTLVACRKMQIQPYLDILYLAGLQAALVDVDCYALERVLPYTTNVSLNDNAVALLNLNAEMSSLIVTQSNKLVYAHDQGYDGQRLISQTNAYLSNNDKDPLNNCDALLNDAAYQDILKNNLISHLRHTLHFFSTSRPNININKLIVTGDCAMVPCLSNFIYHELGIETILANLLTHFVLASQIDPAEFQKHSPGLALCCGLALSRLEF